MTAGALGVAAAGAALTMAAQPALAYSFEYQYTTARNWSNGNAFCTGNHGDATAGNYTAYGCLDPRGDLLEIADAKADGKRVGLSWRSDYGRAGLCVNKAGKDFDRQGQYQVPTGGQVCAKDFAEGHVITFKVGTCNASTTDCSKVANFGEWSDAVNVRA